MKQQIGLEGFLERGVEGGHQGLRQSRMKPTVSLRRTSWPESKKIRRTSGSRVANIRRLTKVCLVSERLKSVDFPAFV